MYKGICILFFTFILLTSIILIGCDEPKSPPTVKISISINPDKKTINAGEEVVFTAMVTASDDKPGDVVWELSPKTGLYTDTKLVEDPSNQHKIILKTDPNETAPSLTVKVTSKRDKNQSASAVVTVIPGTPIDPVTVSIKQPASTIAGAGAKINLEATAAVNPGPSQPSLESIIIFWSVEGKTAANTKIDGNRTAMLTIDPAEAAKVLTIRAVAGIGTEQTSSSASIEIRILHDVWIVGFSEGNPEELPGIKMGQPSIKDGTYTYTAVIEEKTTFRFNINGETTSAAAEWFAPDAVSQNVTLGNNTLHHFKDDEQKSWALPTPGTYQITLDPGNWNMRVKKEGVEALPTPAQPVLTGMGVATWTALANETDVTGYRAELFKNNNSIADNSARVEVNQGGNYEINFIELMRSEGTGSYTVKVAALGNNDTSSDSDDSAASAPQIVTQRPTVTVLNWSGDTATWTAGTGDSSGLGYLVKLYKNNELVNEDSTTSLSVNFTGMIAEHGNGSYTFTVTALGNTTLILNSQESAKSQANEKNSSAPPLAAPDAPSLSDTGAAAWTYSEDANVTAYSLQLYKEGAKQGSIVSKSKGTFSHEFLADMRNAKEGAYTFTVTAVGNGINYSNSDESNKSNEIEITKRAGIPSTHIWWEKNGELRWSNPDGGLNSGGAAGDFVDYTIQVYTHKDNVKTPLGGTRDAERKNQEGDSTWSDYNLAYAWIPAETGVLYSVAVTPKGYGLVIDAEPTESEQIYYTIFGNNRVWSIVQGGAIYTAGADSGKIGWSEDGVTWTLSSQTVFDYSDSVRGIAYSASPAPLLVAVGGTKTAYSSDGKAWTAGTVSGDGGSNQLNNVIYDGSQFIAVGNYGQVIYSADGTSWTRTYQGGAGGKHLYGLAYNGQTTGKLYVAAGAEGRSLSSTDGTSWEWREDNLTGNMSYSINNVAFGANTFVIAGQGGVLKTATTTTINAIPGKFWDAWTNRTSSFDNTEIFNIIFSGGRFIAVGAFGRLSYSDNGETWLTRDYTQTGYGGGEVNNEAYISAAISLSGNRVLLSGNEKSGGWGKMAIITIP